MGVMVQTEGVGCPVCGQGNCITYASNYDGEPIDKDGNVIVLSKTDDTCPLCGRNVYKLTIGDIIFLIVFLYMMVVMGNILIKTLT